MKHFYFHDCPRTGGTSFKRWARNHSKVKHVHYGKEGKAWHHIPFNSCGDIGKLTTSDKLWTFTLLRNPIEHTASLFSKIRQHKHGYRTKLNGLTFGQWVHGIYEADVGSAPAPWGFSMVRFYDPETENLETAIKNIESMDFVGFTDRLDDDLNLLLTTADAHTKFDGRRLNVVRRSFKITDKDKNVIRRVRADDFKLVNHFRKKRGLDLYE